MSSEAVVRVQLGDDWRGIEGIFGGKVLAVAAEEAVAAAGEGFSLASVSLDFTAGAFPGEVEVEAKVLHMGRSTATIQVECSQEQRGRMRRVVGGQAKFVARDLAGERDGVELPPVRALSVPEVATLDDFDPPWGSLSYDHHFGVRQVFSGMGDDGVITTRAWVRTVPGHDLGAAGRVISLLDILAPGAFHTAPLPRFVPTVDFTMHVDDASVPDDGEWVLGEMRTEWITADFCMDTATLRRTDGAFVARGTQTRRVVRG